MIIKRHILKHHIPELRSTASPALPPLLLRKLADTVAHARKPGGQCS